MNKIKQFLCSKLGHKWEKVQNPDYRVHVFVCRRCGQKQRIKRIN